MPKAPVFLTSCCREAARRVGVRVHLISPPAERGLVNANAGIEDGDSNRIAGLRTHLPEPDTGARKNMDMQFMAFTAKQILRSIKAGAA